MPMLWFLPEKGRCVFKVGPGGESKGVCPLFSGQKLKSES